MSDKENKTKKKVLRLRKVDIDTDEIHFSFLLYELQVHTHSCSTLFRIKRNLYLRLQIVNGYLMLHIGLLCLSLFNLFESFLQCFYINRVTFTNGAIFNRFFVQNLLLQ